MRVLLPLIIGLLVIGGGAAIETPRGIDGVVYALDGITPVPKYVGLVIENLDTNETVTTNVGRGLPGRYSVALSWEKGSGVRITASNPNHTTVRNVTLNGIIHGADLFLNMSLPPLPPNITSQPPPTAEELTPYTYTIGTFDWNNDVVSLSFDGPEGMTLVGKTLSWTPVTSQVGEHTINVHATDGTFTTTQTYTLVVQNVNDPPVVNDQTHTVRAREGTVGLIAFDPDGDALNFSIVVGGPGLNISVDGVLSYRLIGDSEEVVVRVSDGEYSDEGSVTLHYTPQPEPTRIHPRSGGGSGGGGDLYTPPKPETTEPEKKPEKKEEPPPYGRLAVLPEGVPPVEGVTYAYFRLPEGMETFDFGVTQSWLEEHGLSPDDVRLLAYRGGWEEERRGESLLAGQTYLTGALDGTTIFAIAADKVPEDLGLREIAINEPVVIIGTLVDADGTPVSGNLPVRVENLGTGEVVTVLTSESPGESTFSLVLDDVSGETFRVSVSDPRYRGSIVFTAKPLNNLRIITTRTGLFSITGFVLGGERKTSLLYLLVLVLLVATAYIGSRVWGVKR